jgi:hypothetical protein
MVSFRTSLCAWGDRRQSCRGRCNLKLGYGLGTGLQQNFGVPTAALDICAQAQPALYGRAGIDRDSFSVRVRHYSLSLATPAITLLTLRLRRL